ncbi:MAG: hypothetical protein QM644_10960 [Mobilitalea sp.]
MVKYLYDNNILLYTFAGLGGLGFLLRFIVNLVYKYLVRESDRLGETKNKTLQRMKMKFTTGYKLMIGVNNVDTFVDKNVLKYKFCRILLSTWDNACGLILYLNLLIVPIITVFGVAYGCGQDQILLAGAVGISSSGMLIIVDKFFNVAAKKKLLRLNLLDYLENICKVRVEQELLNPELIEQYRRDYYQTVESKEMVHATSMDFSRDNSKDELNRRREAKLRKQEEKRMEALRIEEEQRRIEEERIEEEKRKLEEKKQLAAKRREDERRKIDEERRALATRRVELQKVEEDDPAAGEKQRLKKDNKEQILHSIEQELISSNSKVDMDTLLEGMDEIAADREQDLILKAAKAKLKQDNDRDKQRNQIKGNKSSGLNQQEAKLIEDVLKEFFA